MNGSKITASLAIAVLVVTVVISLDQRQRLNTLRVENDQLRHQLGQVVLESTTGTKMFAEVPAESLPPEVTNPIRSGIGKGDGLAPVSQSPTTLEATVQALGGKLKRLNEKLEQNPELNVAELRLLHENEWVAAVLDSEMATDDDAREALSKLRDKAINAFFNEALRPALQRYLDVHNNTMPEDLLELRPYFKVPIEDSVFERYKIVHNGPLGSNSRTLIESIGSVDEDYASEHSMFLNGASGGRVNRVEGMIEEAAKEFVQKHNGAFPQTPEAITPYLAREFPKVTVQKYLRRMLQKNGR